MTKEASFQIAFQGAPGAFSHRAGQLFAEHSGIRDEVKFVPCRSFDEVFNAILSERCAVGVIPLENSSIGSIVANYDLLWKSPVSIIGEVYLPIHHHLLGFAGTQVKALTNVYSHPAALDQCRNFLKSYPAMKPVAYWDTSGAALHVSASANRKNAAIASEFAAKEANLAILKRNVEDHEGNNTRFGIIAPVSAGSSNNGKVDERIDELVIAASKNYPLKLSCVVALPHTPGSLANLLKVFGDLGANLTKIESRPIPEMRFHYRFFLDMEISSREQEQAILKACGEHTEEFKLLGRYCIWQDDSDS
ncbi:MAG TPA: prephenate dehydratase domain-containing protein [Candidatus Obscuribacterales bacterium]